MLWPVAAGKDCRREGRDMSWKFVMNGNAFGNPVEASAAAGKAGYRFFLYNGAVYFRDKMSARISDTGLTEKDLTG